MPLLLFAIPVVSTFIGGLLALRFRRALVLLIALGAGLLLGAAFLDLLPESLSLASTTTLGPAGVLAIALLAFLAFFVLQSTLDALAARWQNTFEPQQTLGKIAGSMLIFHSLRDGMAIGLSFAASHPAGYAVAAGIAAHDIGDGMNTIILTTRGGGRRSIAWLFLVADSLAPLAGGLLTVWWTFSLRSSATLLAIAAGFFLHMATSDFLPEVRQSTTPRWRLLLSVCMGSGLIYAATLLAGSLP